MGKKSDSEKEALIGHKSRENTLKEALKSNFSSYSEKGPQWHGPITHGMARTVPASPGPAWSWEGPASTRAYFLGCNSKD